VSKHTFRIDDISINTDLKRLQTLVTILREHCDIRKIDLEVVLAVTPLVYDMGKEAPKDKERAFPRLFSALSDHRKFYEVHKAGIPDLLDFAPYTPAAHGIVHVDHRLLGREAQELSILVSCHLAKARSFCPPFNKWDGDTESICWEHNISLIRFEDGWLHTNYNAYSTRHEKYYFHTHDTTPEQLITWLNQ
jgi:hypothetical protein